MRVGKSNPWLIATMLLITLASQAPAELVDRMLAAVNDRVILQSDLEEELRLESLSEGKPLSEFSPAAQRAALDRLIEHVLIQDQITQMGLVSASPEQLAARVAEIRRQIPAAQSEAGWHSVLREYGFTDEELNIRILEQLNVLRFIEVRFRPLARVRSAEIEAYYRDTLIPELQKRGAEVPPLKDVSEKIDAILVEQRVDELMAGWLSSLRSQSKIKLWDAGEGSVVRPESLRMKWMSSRPIPELISINGWVTAEDYNGEGIAPCLLLGHSGNSSSA